MCRLAAFPPGFPRRRALEVLNAFARGNADGTGAVHVSKGRFVVQRWPLPLHRVPDAFLRHMPHPGWTVAHLRAASHGVVAMRNTHPFVSGAWAVAHNGIWGRYELVKEVLAGDVDWQGETDSEVATHVLASVGPQRFADLVDGGVFLALNRSGNLWAIKTHGDLEISTSREYNLLASEVAVEPALWVSSGWLRYDPSGELVAQSSRNMFHRKLPVTEDDELTEDQLEWLAEHGVERARPFTIRRFKAGGVETRPRFRDKLPW